MEPPFFYSAPDSFNDHHITLDKTESHHAVKVLRLRMGSLIIIVDGLGNACRAEIVKISRAGLVEAKIHSRMRNYGEPAIILTLAAGLSTGYKFDTVVEKGTELGVKRFVPLITEKSKVKLEDPKRIKTKITRYEKVALSAVKQCRRSYRPEITSIITFDDYMKQTDPDSLNLIFHPASKAQRLSELKFNNQTKRINLLVGPEAGFSDNEIETAGNNGYLPVTLGSRILRTETASPVICALIMNLFGELN